MFVYPHLDLLFGHLGIDVCLDDFGGICGGCGGDNYVFTLSYIEVYGYLYP